MLYAEVALASVCGSRHRDGVRGHGPDRNTVLVPDVDHVGARFVWFVILGLSPMREAIHRILRSARTGST